MKMKQCPKCLAMVDDDANFCTSCGGNLVEAQLQQSSQKVEKPTTKALHNKQGNRVFIDSEEQVVDYIGSNYLQHFLAGGGVSEGIGVLTQMRFYYKGKNYSGDVKQLKSITEEGVVSIEDITFTKFIYSRKPGYLITAIFILLCTLIFAYINSYYMESILSLGLIAAAISFIIYNCSRSTLFTVSFPGGSFGFDISAYPISEVRDFQRQLHLLKDNAKSKSLDDK